MDGVSDAELVRRCRVGEQVAFSLLAARHEARLHRSLRGILSSSADAEDVLQEALLQAYLGIDNLRQPERFGAWLLAIALNLARGQLRERSRLPHTFVGDEDTAVQVKDSRPEPEEWLQQRQTQIGLERALEALPDAEREAIAMVYRDGLSHQETARLLGVSLGAVKVRVHRGRRRLQAALQGDFTPTTAQSRLDRRKVTMIPVVIHDILASESPLNLRSALASHLAAMPEATRESFLAGVTLTLEPRRPLAWKFYRSPDPSLALTDEEQQAYEAATRKLWRHRIVLLKETDGERALPIWIGPFEADALAAKLKSQSPQRPLTADLTTTLLQLAGLRVEQVVISRLHEQVFYASIIARTAQQTAEIDCRPSDAINLAVRLDAPLLVAEEVMAEAGVMPHGDGRYPIDMDEAQMPVYSLVHEQ